MKDSLSKNPNKAIAIWLLAGTFMIMVQVLLGGITRLTESGLSITEWNPITGVLPPLNESAWLMEFDKYKRTDQFRYIHPDFTLSDFKFIFFWEWLHRVWARLLGIVFIAGFVYFLWKRQFKKGMILPLLLLFVLGALQGAIGWIMVKSGLVPEKYFVGHIQLATHFIAALLLLMYTFWFALRLVVPENQLVWNYSLRRLSLSILMLLFLQLTYGAFMAGLRAGAVAPTWPTINGSWFPDSLFTGSGLLNYTDNPFMVQFIHRGLAYLLAIFTLIWFIKARKTKATAWFSKSRDLPIVMVTIQLILGILTVTHASSATDLLWLGVAHQFVAMLLLVVWIWMFFVLRGTGSMSIQSTRS